jgi:ARG/rhodanese/phosphatase superfamily protein
MRSTFKWLVGVAVVAVAIGALRYRANLWAPRPVTEVAAGDSSELIVGEPVRFENLTIFPVTSTVPKDQDRLMTLTEGLKSGLVLISEVGVRPGEALVNPFGDAANANGADPPAQTVVTAPAKGDDPFAAEADEASADADDPSVETADDASMNGNDPFADGNQDQLDVDGDVNHLLVTNNSDQPLYLMPGEILVGGKQDRTVADELVVAPHTKRMSIEVFCVEHGRWSPRSSEQTALLAADLSGDQATDAAPSQAAASRLGGAFSVDGGYLGKNARLSVQSGKDQSDVWEEVGLVISQTQAVTSSGAFTANYFDAQVTSKLEPYMAALEKAIADKPQVVGVIVAVNGKILAADAFESTPLFLKLWPKLLKSYALDATMQSEEQADKLPVCEIAEAKTFLRNAMRAKVAATTDRNGLVTTRGDGQTFACFSLHESPASRHMRRGYGGRASAPGIGGGMGEMSGGMGGSFGSGVHSAAFSK